MMEKFKAYMTFKRFSMWDNMTFYVTINGSLYVVKYLTSLLV